MPARLLASALGLAGTAAAAFAQAAGHPGTHPPGAATAQPHIECFCRAQGRNHNVGTTICFETAAGLASFRCEMDQNVTSWRPQSVPCPTT